MAKKPNKSAKRSAVQQPRSKAKKAKSSKRGKPSVPSGAKDKCFVISPFGGWYDEYYTEIFCPAIKSAGLEPGRADDLFRSSNIVHDIWDAVSSSRVLLADLTNKNPNVFYELGLAHAAHKPVLLLTQSIEDVPFDLRALRVIPYDVEHPEWGKRLRENIKKGLNETLDAPEESVLPTFLVERPGGELKVSKEEARFIGLQQQLDSLRAELHAAPGGGKKIAAPEARAMVRALAEEGMPRGMIVERVSARGAPRSWVRSEVDRVMREEDED